jgi:hypothetical protein
MPLQAANSLIPRQARPTFDAAASFGTSVRKRTASVAGVLLAVNLILVMIAVIGFLPGPFVLIDPRTDGGVWEMWEAAQLGGAAVLLAAFAFRERMLSPALVAAVLLYLIADNLLRIHEAYGLRMGGFAYGEFLYLMMVGGIVVVVLGAALLKAGPRERAISLVFAGLFGVLAGFGVALDLVHSLLLDQGRIFDIGFTAVEELGELLTCSLIFIAALAAWKGQGQPGTAPLQGVSRGLR